MLKGNYDEALLEKSLLDADDLLAGGGMALSEAEQQEVLTYDAQPSQRRAHQRGGHRSAS
jgi:hypothetical protein